MRALGIKNSTFLFQKDFCNNFVENSLEKLCKNIARDVKSDSQMIESRRKWWTEKATFVTYFVVFWVCHLIKLIELFGFGNSKVSTITRVSWKLQKSYRFVLICRPKVSSTQISPPDNSRAIKELNLLILQNVLQLSDQQKSGKITQQFTTRKAKTCKNQLSLHIYSFTFNRVFFHVIVSPSLSPVCVCVC